MKRILLMMLALMVLLGVNSFSFAAEPDHDAIWKKGDVNKDEVWDRSEFNEYFKDRKDVGSKLFDWYDFDNDNAWSINEWNAFADDADKRGLFELDFRS